MEGDEGHGGGHGVIAREVAWGGAEGVARAAELQAAVGGADDFVSWGGGGGIGGGIPSELSDGAVQAEGLEEGVGHDGLAGPSGVDAVLAGDHVAGAVLLLGGETGGEHGPEDVGEADALGLGDVDVVVAQLEEAEVEVVLGAGGGLHPGGHGADRAGRSQDHADVGGFELADDFLLVFNIFGADFGGVGHVAVVVHAVAGRGHGGVKAEDIALHALGEAGGLLAAPAVLAAGDAPLGDASGEVGFDESAVHFLLGDGVAADS